MARSPGCWAQLGLIGSLLIAALAAMEGWERQFAWPADPSWYRLTATQTEITFRSQRFAPVRFTPHPSSGRRRILVAGGSTAFGFPERPAGEAPTNHVGGFVAAMQAAVDHTAPGTVEFVNLGINGGNSEDTLRVLRRATRWGAVAVVLYDGHNEFMNVPRHFSAALWRFAMYRRAMGAAPRPVAAPGWVGPPAYEDAAHEAAILANFRTNLEAISDLGWPVIVSTQAANLEGLDPSWSVAGNVDELRSLGSLSDHALAERWRSGPPAADVAFAYGQRAVGSNRAAALREAADLDGLPFRATSAINATIRSVAAERKWILVDAESATGSREFYDNVHPLPTAAARLASALLDGLHRAGVISANPKAVTVEPIDPAESARRTAAYWLRWACVRRHDPGLRVAATQYWARRLLELRPGNADAHAILDVATAMAAGSKVSPPDNTELHQRMTGIHPCVAQFYGPAD